MGMRSHLRVLASSASSDRFSFKRYSDWFRLVSLGSAVSREGACLSPFETMNLKPDSLLEDFLAAVHQLKFSKVSEATEVVDVERRCVTTKFLASKQFDSEDAAAAVLQRGLWSYQSQMENKSGVNNYWRQVKAFTSKVTNDPLQWKSCLTDPSVALQALKPLPCQFVNTNSCKNLEITDRHVEDVISAWKLEDRQSRKRKIATHNRLNLRFNSSNGNDNSSLNLQGISHGKGASQCKEDIRRQVPQLNLGSKDSNNVKEKLINIQKSSYFKPKLYSKSALRGSMNSQEDIEENEVPEEKVQLFKTARQELKVQQSKRNRQSQGSTLENRRTVNSKFVCPFKRERESVKEAQGSTIDNTDKNSELEDERLKNIEPKMVELIRNEIMDSGSIVSWDEIAGLEYAKKTIQEIVVFPMLRPDIFTGLRRPPKGILLFGPPGTGKTLIGKCIASQSKSTFFSISASSLTSKWIGEGEKMVRALFAVARVYQPAVIFIDEIDSLLSQRSDSEHESSRRIKTEFLVQLDGATTAEEDRILVVGATNRPQELDEAARRRLVKRLYIPLPELEARKQIISNLLASEYHNLTLEEMCTIAKLSEGYSGADMTNLCKEASMGPIRSIPFSQLENISKEDVRQVTLQDFKQALSFVRSSVSQADLSVYVDWDRIYGTGSAQNCTL